MAFTFNNPPTTDRDKLRLIIGDVTSGSGPAPGQGNVEDSFLTYFLDEANDIPGAAALAFEHLAALWITKPIFGPGELSTIHVDMYRKFKQAADDWRARSTSASDDLGSGAIVSIGSFTRVDGYTDNGSEYT